MGHETKRVSKSDNVASLPSGESDGPRRSRFASRTVSGAGFACVLGVAVSAAACGTAGESETDSTEIVAPTVDDVETVEQALNQGDQNAAANTTNANTPIGLSLWWEEGKVRLLSGAEKTVDLYENFPRYMQEIDITSQVTTTTDQGIDPIKNSGDMARLDWRGVVQTDIDWRPEGNVPETYTRSRFYRKAKWMQRASVLSIFPVDDRGRLVGLPILEVTGEDDDLRDSDGGFVRRFDARQVTRGCRAIGDCSNATSFTAQGLMQFRDSLHPTTRAQRIPQAATRLKMLWSEDPTNIREVKIAHKKFADTPYRYGFKPTLTPVNPPANGQFYVRGEGIDFRVAYRDGAGNQLNPPGELPSYAEALADAIPSGIRYYDGFRQVLTVYYALKHREGNNIWNFQGPVDQLKVSHHVVPIAEFFSLAFSQIPMAITAEDGYYAAFNLIPNPAYELDPVLSQLRPSDILHVQVPDDAKPGTYQMTMKGRRDWGGEAINQGVTVNVQVGQAAATTYVPKTGNCQTCHNGQSGFDKVLHRISDRKTCFGCHASLQIEPDQRLDFRIHFIHTRSNRMEANPYNCSTCHLSPPNGPPVGFPGVDLVE